MKKLKFTCALLLFALYASISLVSAQTVATEKRLDERTLLDRWNELKNRALAENSIAMIPRSPRLVKKKAGPVMILKDNKIYFNENELKLSAHIASWKSKIGGTPRCFINSMIFCVWDDLGLQVGTDNEKNQQVKFLNIRLNRSEFGEMMSQIGNSEKSKDMTYPDLSPHHTFSGYLELDGFGIDEKTEYWEVYTAANPDKHLRCGLLDCSHPRGLYGEYATINLMLDGSRESNNFLEISISANE